MANYKQMSLLSPGKVTEVHLREDHELVQITELLDWDELILMAMNCRSAKVKKETGPQPKYRELLGAVVLMSVKGFDYRQAEDMIAHYAPARYLCDLMSSLSRESIAARIYGASVRKLFINCSSWKGM
jgi:hypothetical protein